MSGGSLDYAFGKIEDLASTIQARATTPLHRAFAGHLTLVAEALHDLEWVWSGDFGTGDEEAAIRAVIAKGAELRQAIVDAQAAQENLMAVLDRAEKATKP